MYKDASVESKTFAFSVGVEADFRRPNQSIITIALPNASFFAADVGLKVTFLCWKTVGGKEGLHMIAT